MKKLFYTLAGIALSFGASAQLIFDENFNYTTNDSISANGWSVSSGGTTNAIRATGTALSFTGYPTANNGVGNSASLTTSGQDAYKDGTSSITTGSAYASFLVNISATQATGDYFFGVLPNTSSTTYSCRVYAKNSANSGFFNVAINKSNETPVYSTTDFAIGQTHLFFVEYKFNSGTNDDSVYLYVIPNGSTFPTTKPAVATAAGFNSAQADLANVGRLALRQGSGSNAATLTIDGIRMGGSWSNGELPVTWKSFTATKNTDATVLKWSTASEINNSRFDVQRSVDGKTFETIASIKGGGNSSKVSSYSFEDVEKVTAKTVYYRLKQVDFDGKSAYSKTVSVVNNVQKVALGASLPNPFNDELTVNINSTSNGTATVTLMDMIGKVHHTSIEVMVAGTNKVAINTIDMPNGIYFVRVSINGEIFTQKVIKK